MLRFRLLALASLAPAPALAAPPAPIPAAPAAPADPLKPAFEALPDPERRALQEALVWTGDFNGAVAGTYGPRTHEALLAYARKAGVPEDAALSAAVRGKLLAAATAARSAVGFATLRDGRSGLAIGLPLKLLPVRSPIADGTRYAAQDGTIVVDTAGHAAGTSALDDTFARLTRDAPERHVTYKLARPDFIVVSGEVADRKFYSRYALGQPVANLGQPAAGGLALRGFTLSYPKASADMDRIALAVAASFAPFPPAAEAPAVPPAPAPAVLAGAAVLVGPGLALTRADVGRCAAPLVDGVAASWARQDPGSGLALLTLSNHRDGAAVPLSVAALPRLALFLVPGAGAPALGVADVAEDGPGWIRAPLQGGGIVLDDAGALAGLTRPPDGKAVAVGGVLAVARYDLADAARLGAFLKAAAVPTAAPGGGAAVAAGEAAARWHSAILPLRCRVPPTP